tara:strand:+ start:186 stop:830 length:645 start_codon:yes stop_codon:yes gene_type:complete
MNKSVNFILLIFILAILLIGWIRAEEPFFFHWTPYIWLSILTFLNWYIAAKIFFIGKSKNPLFGVLPIISIVLLIGSLISAVLMFLNSTESALTSNFHLITQILVIATTSIFLILFKITSLLFGMKTTDIKKDHISKIECIKIINQLLNQVPNEQKQHFKKIMNIIEYDLPHDNKLQDINDWQTLSSNLKNYQTANQLSVKQTEDWIKLAQKIQ